MHRSWATIQTLSHLCGAVDGYSWNNKRLNFVTFVFQASVDLFEYQTSAPSNEAANIFTDDPPG
jgi:hypothetical protein